MALRPFARPARIAGFDGYYKRVNPAFEQTLGYPSEELLSRPFLDFIHPDDHESCATRSPISSRERRDRVREPPHLRRRLGALAPVEHPSRAGQGPDIRRCRDVTDRRHADAELREAQRIVEASRDELRMLAEEQAALRRVATLVARGVPSADVFAAVAEELGAGLVADSVEFFATRPTDGNDEVAWTEKLSTRPRSVNAGPLDGDNVASLVFGRGGRRASTATRMPPALSGAFACDWDSRPRLALRSSWMGGSGV